MRIIKFYDENKKRVIFRIVNKPYNYVPIIGDRFSVIDDEQCIYDIICTSSAVEKSDKGKIISINFIRVDMTEDDYNDDDEFNVTEEVRDIEQITAAEEELFEKIWYHRHRMSKYKNPKGVPEAGIIKAKEIENKYSKQNLIFSDFDLGMLHGKLSAIRWASYDEWDNFDT